MNLQSKIYVAGHRGLLGSAVVRNLREKGFHNLLLRTSHELDLMKQQSTFEFLESEKPEFVFLCAAKVGGIKANRDAPAEFLYRNLQIQNNVIEGSHRIGVKKLMFVGSSCIYPLTATCPIREIDAKPGPFEITNEGYALAKMTGLRMCQYYRSQYGSPFISAIPTNLFGANDNYDLDKAHLLPALIRKIHTAKVKGTNLIEVWGSGTPRREFMLSDDCADALVFLMQNYSSADPVNVGTGEDRTILELAEAVAKVLGVQIEIRLDPTKPDGIMRKVLDVTRLKELGWVSRMSLEEGIQRAYEDFLQRAIS